MRQATGPLPLTVAETRSALRDLHVLKQYKAGKNSFVLGLEGMCNRPVIVKPGGRRTILNLAGQGSLRHLWATSGPLETITAYHFEFFVDGEISPSLHGLLPDLIAAARRSPQPLVLNPGGMIANDSMNLYLPVPFERSLRVDLIADRPIGLVFLQLDYRLEDDSLAGVRLIQQGAGPLAELRYTGPLPSPSVLPPAAPLRPERAAFSGDGMLTLTGPGIIRRLAVNARRPGVRLRIRFDGEPSAAVDADLADFFGPFRGPAFNNNQCYLPMPFARGAQIEIQGAAPGQEWRLEADVEPVPAFESGWGYFHAQSSMPQEANGFEPVPLLDTAGRGQWLGMSLYASGHDHGGGDFAVIDGGTPAPLFLHGINGEDYFSFAFFGKGQNHPYSEAFDNNTGRLRLHLENPYPFTESIQTGWGTLKGEHPRAVSFWYQDSPADRTRTPEQASGLRWQVFGPVEAPLQADGNTPDVSSAATLFAPLPAVADLDAGREIEASHLMFGKRFPIPFKGWAAQTAAGPHLNLMYCYGHGAALGDHAHMGYYARLMMAGTTLTSATRQTVTLQLSYDDPIELSLDGAPVFSDLTLREGFTTRTVPVTLEPGANRLLLRICDTPNLDTCWAGINLRVLDRAGRDITAALQP